ncbi:hypothetical protein PYW07_000150 [Mythimna separata]|uniref:Uncharacterized protein n=1 Tax=Mythimna separata TaxID=271217 RepID=A0AAD7Z2S0_MYTSE|nr:hypothetical protein PYW07_000150 [Mythimna separata]
MKPPYGAASSPAPTSPPHLPIKAAALPLNFHLSHFGRRANKLVCFQLLIAAFVLFFIAETIRSERRRLYGTSAVTMEVDKVIFPGLTNGSRMYSPVTLSREWPTLGRLVGMVFAAVFGATMNGYFVTSFLIDTELSRIENVYHCCLGFADMMITAGVIPIAAVVLLSGVWDIYPVCQGLQGLTTASTYCYSIFFALVAAENYFRSFKAGGYGIQCYARPSPRSTYTYYAAGSERKQPSACLVFDARDSRVMNL